MIGRSTKLRQKTHQQIVSSLSASPGPSSAFMAIRFLSLLTAAGLSVLVVLTTTSKVVAVVDAFGLSLQNPTKPSHLSPSCSQQRHHQQRHQHQSLFSSMWGLEEDPIERQKRTGNEGSPSPPNMNSSPGGGSLAKSAMSDEVWKNLQPIKVQGGSLRTWSFQSPYVDSIQVHLRTEGRPLNANVELWKGPDNTPQKVAVYLEDGSFRPFRCTILIPDEQNAISIRNTAQMEYPLHAAIQAGLYRPPSSKTNDEDDNNDKQSATERLASIACTRIIQGGAVFTMPFSPTTASVEIVLKTDGRPLNARIELLHGPNNVKQVMELYTEDGFVRPFYAIVDTPGTGNVIRIVNTATVEFPIQASVEPYFVEEQDENEFVVSS
mmetsp:Transcript_20513/g.48707  ORF Transcript_20513/g.48707 Transcript_20513/m.48707 type:complete len:379 (-) Transcript_20513:267-1403(-)